MEGQGRAPLDGVRGCRRDRALVLHLPSHPPQPWERDQAWGKVSEVSHASVGWGPDCTYSFAVLFIME